MRATEFVTETAEEIRELESLAQIITDKVRPIFGQNPNAKFRLEILNLPTYKNPAVNSIIDNAVITCFTPRTEKEKLTNGYWNRFYGQLTMNVALLNKPEKFKSTIIHELTHALDGYKGVHYTQANHKDDPNKTDDENYNDYLRLQPEIDARLSQALFDLAGAIKQEQEVHGLFDEPGTPTPEERTVLAGAIKSVFQKHNIARIFPNGAQDPAYRRLLTRTYKFYTTPKAAPMASNRSVMQTAFNFIRQLGNSFHW